MGDESEQDRSRRERREITKGSARSIQKGDMGSEDQTCRAYQGNYRPSEGQVQPQEGLTLRSGQLASSPTTVGAVLMSRKRVRLWIENYAPDGERGSLSVVELDRKQVLQLIEFLQRNSQ